MNFGSLKQSVHKFSGKLGDSPLWKKNFEVFTFMVGSMPSILAVHDMVIRDVSGDTQCFVSQGFSENHIMTTRIGLA